MDSIGVPLNNYFLVLILQFNIYILLCAYGVMDSTMVFGTISSGSNPDRRTKTVLTSL